MYVLILTIVLWGVGSQQGGGGPGVTVHKFATLEQCLKVKSEFLFNMKMTNAEIVNNSRKSWTTVTRRANCVKI